MSASASANFTNISDTAISLKFSPTFRLAASVIYDILLILSLLINLLQLATYIKERKVLKTMAFFVISSQMLLFNLIVLIVMIIFMTTAAISDQPLLSDDVYFVLAFAEGLSYNGLLLFAFLLTLNRIMVFAFPKRGRYFFMGWRIYFLIVLFWILAAVLVYGIMLQSPCQIVAKPEDLGFGNECIEGEANIYNYIGQYIATYIPILMIVLYILLCIEIKIGIFCNSYCCSLSNLFPKAHKKKGHNVAEIKLLLQAGMICSTFFIQNFCWTYLPFITSKFEYGKELIFFAVMLSSILLYSVNAIVVLIFNGTVRRGALGFFRKNKSVTTTKAVTLY